MAQSDSIVRIIGFSGLMGLLAAGGVLPYPGALLAHRAQPSIASRPSLFPRLEGQTIPPQDQALAQLLPVDSRSARDRLLKRHRKKNTPPPVTKKPDKQFMAIEKRRRAVLERLDGYSHQMDQNRDGFVDPLERELARERLRELDRNRDGGIDPMERALGRVDLQHDAPTRPRD